MAAQWPPRSPHEALISTPRGRERLRRLAEPTSPSPSPSRPRTSRSIPAPGGDDALFEGGDVDDEEDEEMLQLKLQAIQARLRLKKLQAAKAQRKTAAAAAPGPRDTGAMREVPLQSKLAAVRDRMERQAASGDLVQVPASPVKKSQTMPDLQTSPQRVLLGIDKGLKAADVSLKRAPGHRRGGDVSHGQQRSFLRRARSPPNGQAQEEAPRPQSFNERLASARTEELARKERRERAQKLRSTAFSVGKQEMEDYKTKALDLPDLPSRPQEFSRDQILASMGKPSARQQLPRSNTAPAARLEAPTGASDDPFSAAKTANNAQPDGAFEAYSGLHLSKRILPHNVLARAVSGKKVYLLKDLLRKVKAPDWSLPDDESDIVVFAIVASKSDPRSHRPAPGGDGKSQQDRGKYMVLTLVDLTYEVELFLFNSGFDRFWKLTPGTVLAILNPGILPPPPGREATNRFGLVINSDEDTILEIGNARDIGYCKSIKKDGTYCKSWVNARRTEYCEFHTNEAVRKARSARIEMSTTAGFGSGDGSRGRNNSRGVFARSGDDQKLGHYDRATQSQYFISTAHRTTDPDDERITGIADRREREEGLKRRLAQKEKERDIARRLGKIGGGAGREYMSRAAAAAGSTARAAAPPPPPASSSFSSAVTSSFSSSSAAPVSTTTSASSLGTSASTSTSTITPATTVGGSGGSGNDQQPPRKWDARALGLIGRRGADQPKISLAPPPATSSTTARTASGPTKRKRPESAGSSSTVSATGGGGLSKSAPLGWGSLLKDKLSRMREGERLDGQNVSPPPAPAAAPPLIGGTAGGGTARGDKSPVRKKTRFVTEKGIREAGRESLGEPLSGALKTQRQVLLDDDDDEDLIVVR